MKTKQTPEQKRKADRERMAAKRAAAKAAAQAEVTPAPTTIEIPKVEAKPKKAHFGPRKSDNPALQALYDERCALQRSWDAITKELRAATDPTEIERLKVARRAFNAPYNEIIKKIKAFA